MGGKYCDLFMTLRFLSFRVKNKMRNRCTRIIKRFDRKQQ